jgi:integrase
MLTHQDQTLLRLAWDTGARRSEMLSLDQKDIDLAENVINIRHSKGGYGNRVVPFTKLTGEYLSKQIECMKSYKIMYVFVDHDWNRLDVSACDKRIREIGNIRVPGHEPIRLHLHALRHSLAMRLLNRGANESYVARILGHSNLNMTQHYIHYSKGRSREIYDALVG